MSKRSKRSKRKKTQQAGTLKSYRVFRFYHLANHPAVIIKREGKILEGFTISHSLGERGRKTVRLFENPEFLASGEKAQRKTEACFLHLQKRTGKIGHEFSKEALTNYRLSDVDEVLVDKILRAKREGLPFSYYFTAEEKSRIFPKTKGGSGNKK